MMTKDARRVMALAAAIKRLEAKQRAALEKVFPLGTTVRCYLMHGQVNPSLGDVISHEPGSTPYLRLRLHSRARKVRDVQAAEVW